MTAEPRRRAVARGPERFLVAGRLIGLPRRLADRDEVFAHLAGRVLVGNEVLDEKTFTARLAEVADDPVGLRRYLVDAGQVWRTPDGSVYRRANPPPAQTPASAAGEG